MKISKVFVVIAVLMLAATMISGNAEAGRADKRQKRQTSRIKQGVKSGDLTKKEARRARTNQRRIKKAEKRAKSDGKLTKKEKRRLNRMQNKSSKGIARMKHNRKKRPSGNKDESHVPGTSGDSGESLPAPSMEE